MGTEDNTFNRLKRSSFEDADAEIKSLFREYAHGRIFNYHEKRDLILSKAGWTVSEYINESVRRYYI